jgi:predicted ATP-grasp superfamily ATP-dependent carboligase
MRIFVYEYTSARAASTPGDSLAVEGRAMLAAVLGDFGRIPGVETVTLPGGDEPEAFRELARTSVYTLLIAPEFDGLLSERCAWAEEVGGRLLGPSSIAVGLTADKCLLASHLRDADVPTPPCFAVTEPIPFPAVIKPRDGAGSQATFLVHNRKELAQCLAEALAEEWHGELFAQPFLPGTPASVAVLVGPNQCVPLLPAVQRISDDGRFRYLGGGIPLDSERGRRAVDLARRAVTVVPGLRGYVGVDLVLGETDAVLEINPRLTTSYVGLRALARTNLAEAMLRVAAGDKVSLVWRDGAVDFRADGTVSLTHASAAPTVPLASQRTPQAPPGTPD